jgi:hypothetical protein
MMRTITVYRVDYAQKSKVPIGWVKERRKKDRGDNLIGLLRLARKTFALSPEDALHIAVDGKEAGKTPDRNRFRRDESYGRG